MMKKVVCGLLAVMMVVCIVGCGSPEDKVAKYVESLSGQMESVNSSLAEMGAEVSVEAEGTAIIVNMSYDAFDNEYYDMVGDDGAEQLLDAFMESSNLLEVCQQGEEAVTAVILKIYSSEGDFITEKEYK